MNTPTLVVAFVAAGAVGGVVGALVAGSDTTVATTPVAAVAPSVDGVVTHDDLDAVTRRLATLEANLSTANADVARLSDAVDERDAAIASLQERLSSAGVDGAIGGIERDLAGAEKALSNALREGALRQIEGQVMGLGGGRFQKAAELRRLTDEERWTKARDALGLSGYQEEELKTALAERKRMIDEAMKDSEQTIETANGGKMVLRMPDPEKMREAHRTYSDRVDRALTADQAKQWRDDGYENAMGGGGAHVTSIAIGAER